MTAIDQSTQQRIEQWLQGPYDEGTKAEIRQMQNQGQAQALVDAFYKDLDFGTGGMRGEMGVGTNRMNQYTVGAAAQGFANYLKQSYPKQSLKLAVAYDSRNNSRYFADIAAGVFSANGAEVYLFKDLRPVPELSFAIRHLGCQGGVVITASHNPKEYNGFKAYWADGGQLVPPHDKATIREVKQISAVEQIHFGPDESRIRHIEEEVDEPYLNTLLGLSLSREAIRNQSQLKIVFSPLHGAGAVHVPELLKRMGFRNVRVVPQQAQPNGDFPTVEKPNPEESEAMQMALQEAENWDADLVMATDPDGDRVGMACKNLEGQWQLLNGNQTASILFYYVLEAWKRAGKIAGREMLVKTIVTTDILHKIAEDYGVECIDTLTGFKYIAETIRQHEGQKTFIVGGEESYGYLIGDAVRDKDAVAACGILAEMVAYAKDHGLSVFDWLVKMYQQYGFFYEDLLSLTYKGKVGSEKIEQMMKGLRAQPPKTLGGSEVVRKIDYKVGESKDLRTGATSATGLPQSDVLQFLCTDGTKVTARPSGTEPKIKFYFAVQAPLPSADHYDQVREALAEKVEGIQEELKLV